MTKRSILLFLGLHLIASSAQAGSLSVFPIRADVSAPARSASVTLANEGSSSVNIQIRIFKWVLRDGEDFYEETSDVVATPPVAVVPVGGSAQIRIMRVAQQPVAGEEPYRLIVDEIPDANRIRNAGVNIAMRYAIPIFFVDADAAQPKLLWSIRSEGGKRMLAVSNSGDRSRRISNLRLGALIIRRGLAGYALGHSTRMWPLPANATAARVLADSENGAVDAPVSR